MASRQKSHDAATDIKCASYIRQLRAHLMYCRPCSGAIKAGDHSGICLRGRELTFAVVKYSAILWQIKKAAYANPDGIVYACPNIRMHGPTAQDTACPLVVTDYAERLF